VGNIAHRSETRDHRKYRSVSLLHLGKPTKRERIFARSWTRNERALGAGYKVGTLQFGGGVIDCTVRNVSERPAALDVATPVGIPATFTLAIPGDGLHFACRVLWRKQSGIRIKFA
jgi:hypothetical protein